MHPALLKLLKLQIRGRIRRILRGLKTPRGAIFFGVGILMICLWVGPSILVAFTGERSNPETLRTLAPLGLLAMCVLTVVTSAGEKAMYFDPSEVNFLFAGPFKRREMLLYNLAGGALAALLMALFFSAFLLRAATLWIAIWVGTFLALLFVLLVSTTFLLIRQIVSEYAYSWVRKLVLVAVIVLIAPVLWHALAAGEQGNMLAFFRQLRETWPVFCLLALFDVFGRAIAAETLFPQFVGWATLALIMDLALLALVVRLDANYLEAAAAISEKIYARVERAKRGGVADAPVSSRSARWHLPRLPWMGGAGPIAWRQLTTALRNWRAQLIVLVFIAVFVGPAFKSLAGKEEGSPGAMLGALIGVTAWLSLWFTTIVPFDFRGDLDRMDWLKMLPLRSPAIVLGQLAAPVLVFTALEVVLLGGLAVFMKEWRLVLLVAVMFTLPYNFLLFGMENLIFLLFPTRMGKVSPGDFQAFGRQMVVFLMKIPAILVCCGVAAGLGGIAFWITGRSWLAFALVSWVTLTAMAAAVVPYIAWAFQRFDVSVDTPA